MNKTQKIVAGVWAERIQHLKSYPKSYMDAKKADARLISLIRPKTKILDVGCFFPYEAMRLATCGFRVTSIDLSDEVISKSKELPEVKKLKNLKFEIGDATNLKYPNESFDVVLDLTTSVMIPNWQKAIREYSRVLKKGGEVVVVTNNKLQPHALIELVRQKLNKNIHPRWGYFSPTYPWELKRELGKNKFEVLKFESEVMWVAVVPLGLDKNIGNILYNLKKFIPILKYLGWRYGFYAVKK